MPVAASLATVWAAACTILVDVRAQAHPCVGLTRAVVTPVHRA